VRAREKREGIRANVKGKSNSMEALNRYNNMLFVINSWRLFQLLKIKALSETFVRQQACTCIFVSYIVVSVKGENVSEKRGKSRRIESW
jgi:hypothetical protein